MDKINDSSSTNTLNGKEVGKEVINVIDTPTTTTNTTPLPKKNSCHVQRG
jgi:predicted Zn-dependent protease